MIKPTSAAASAAAAAAAAAETAAARARVCWLRTNWVITNGAAAKVMNFDRLGKRYTLFSFFGNIKVG